MPTTRRVASNEAVDNATRDAPKPKRSKIDAKIDECNSVLSEMRDLVSVMRECMPPSARMVYQNGLATATEDCQTRTFGQATGVTTVNGDGTVSHDTGVFRTSTEPPHPTYQNYRGENELDHSFGQASEPARARINALVGGAIPLHAHVRQNVKEKIWAQEYVELSLCLPRSSFGTEEYALSVNKQAGGSATLSFAPTEKPRQIESFEQWQRAFEIFSAVILSNPMRSSEAAGLLKYGQTIRELYQCNANWRGYDDSFRVLKRQQSWAWGEIPAELWMKAMSRATSHGSFTQDKRPFLGHKKGGDRSNRKTHCFKYNKGESHDEKSCTYPHICRYCYKPGHNGSNCWQKWGKPTTNIASSTNQTGPKPNQTAK